MHPSSPCWLHRTEASPVPRKSRLFTRGRQRRSARGLHCKHQRLVSQIALALAISFGWFLINASIALLVLTAFAFAHQTACATALGTALQKHRHRKP